MAHFARPIAVLIAYIILFTCGLFVLPGSPVRAQTWEQMQQQMRQQAAQDKMRELQIQRMLQQQRERERQQQLQQQQWQQQQWQRQQQAEQQRQQQLRQQQDMDRQFCFSQCQMSYNSCNIQIGANQSCMTNQNLCMMRC